MCFQEFDAPVIKRRQCLPKPEQAERSPHVWSLIKDMVGSDNVLSAPLPTEMHLPLTELEKQAEELEYCELLDKAALCPKGSIERMMEVVAFSVSPYASCKRPKRSLDPLLGETYELVHPEKGFRMVSEHVARQPPIMAQHTEGRGWVLESENEPQVSFYGAYVDLNMNFVLQVTFHDGEVYLWHKVQTTINNLIVGKIYIQHTGTYTVKNMDTGLTAVMELVKPKLMTLSTKSRNEHLIKGHLEQDGKKLDRPVFHGKWDQELYADLADGSERLLWKVNPTPKEENRWGLSVFAMQANEMTEGLREKLPPTDSRLRPDLRQLEHGNYDKANAAKKVLEERNAARMVEVRASRADKAAVAPHFFELAAPDAPLGRALRWRYRDGSYWEARRKGDWSDCRDLFGLGQ
ncbi:g2907 [Coccomyxa elongata]